MNLTPFKPRNLASSLRPFFGEEVSSLQREMNSLMSNFLSNKDLTIPTTFGSTWYPPIDLREKDNKYVIEADVPGINENDLDIDFHDNVLTIKGETKTEKEVTNKEYVCVERTHGSFRRDIRLGDEVDKESIKANLKNGVLHIEMNKIERSGSQHKKIQIKH